MATRSFISVPVATFQPAPTAADPVRVRDAHVGEEDLVELGLAGDLAQRPHVDPGRVSCRGRNSVRPRCFGTSGSVRATRMPQCASCASDVHTFCPETTQSAPSSRTARVASEARSDPAPGSLNSWHQTSSPVHSGPQPALALVVGAVGEDRRRGHTEADAVAARVVVRGARRRQRRVRHGLERAAARRGRRARPGSAPRPGPRRTGRAGSPAGRWRRVVLSEQNTVTRSRIVPGREVGAL